MSDLQNLIAAIDRNTAAVTLLANNCGGTAEEKAARKTRTPKIEAVTTQVEAPVISPVAAPVAAPPVQSGPTPASAASAVGGQGPTLQKVADAIIDLANTVSREAAVKILAKYGASKVPQIKSSDFAAVLADVAAGKNGGADAGLM